MLSMGVGAQAWALEVIDGPPEGFETLDAPKQTVVELHYGGELIGYFPVHYTPHELSFDAPLEVLARIDHVTDEAIVGSALANPMPLHAERICGKREVRGCGHLAPEVAGVIFDETRLTAELFINRNLLEVSDETGARYLPLPKRAFSSIYRWDGAVSGTDRDKPNFALASGAVYSFGEANFTSQTSYSNEGLRFDRASAGIERNGWAMDAGLIRSLPMQLAGDRDIAGASISTSLRTRLDSRKVEGNDLIVYLPRRSFVSIYREGRLYSSRQYEAGNQRLDTSELPDGAYNVMLRIEEAGGASREEMRFFAKSEQLPPPDAPTYYLQAGVLRESAAGDAAVPRLTQDPLVRAGTVRRVSDNLGLGASLLGISDRAAVEASAFFIYAGLQSRVSFLSSSKGDAGAQANLQYIGEDWSAVLDARKLQAGDEAPENYDGIFNDLTQATFYLNYILHDDITLSARGSYFAAEGLPDIISYGPAMSWRMWQEGESSLYLTADAAHKEQGYEATVLARFLYRFGRNGITSEGGGTFGGDSRGGYGSVRGWRDYNSPEESWLISAGGQHDRGTTSLGADGNWRTQMGRVQGAVQQSLGETDSLNYGGNFSIGALQAENMVAIGGSDSNQSAVVVEARGEMEGETTIYINSSERGSVPVGGRQVIYLTPYETYRVRLLPKSGGMMQVEGGEKKVTLYPGNVAHLIWEVNAFTVVAGEVVTPEGVPLANALLEKSRARIATDQNGRFQAEITRLDDIYFAKDAERCKVELPPGAKPRDDVLVLREPLVCRPQ